MKNLTIYARCKCCDKKFTEHENIFDFPDLVPGKRQRLCASCYNYKIPRIYWTLVIFIVLFIIIGFLGFLISLFFADNKILQKILVFSYGILIPIFITFLIFLSHKKL